MVNPLRNSPLEKAKPKRPSDFETDEDFLSWVRETYSDDLEADRENREEAVEDLKFLAGEQWDEAISNRRRSANKPVMTLNRLPAVIGQLLGNRRLNEQTIRVLPDNGGTKDVARIRQEIIRNICKNSKSDRVFNNTYQSQVSCGKADFQVVMDYADDDVFEQDIKIVPIPNPFAVVWPEVSTDPTGADAPYVFVTDHIPLAEFKKKWPDASIGSIGSGTRITGKLASHGWISEDEVQVVSVWRMHTERRVVALLATVDGEGQEVEDITDRELDEDIISRLIVRENGEPMIRETDRKYAEMHLVTGTDILSGPYRLPIRRVPVFRASGWEVNVGERRVRFGLIRFLRDPQRIHNYWRSVIAEKLMQSPKANFIADANSIQGFEKQWEQAHRTDTPLLKYNSEKGPPPSPVPPSTLEPALLNEAGMAAQDIRDISNISEASLGQTSNEVSGKAILARQRVGEIGTVIYNDNLNDAIEECGSVINQLIPIAYDTPRTIPLLGEDTKEGDFVKINDTTDEESVDITLGKYSVTLTTGPSYVTRRVEAAESMLNMVNAMPDTFRFVADMLVEVADWPNSDKIAERVKMALPPGVLSDDELTPEMRQQQAQQQQAQQQQAQLQQQIALAELAEKKARALESFARAEQAQAQAAKAQSEVGTKAYSAASDAALREFENNLEALKVLLDTGA
jgi:hypothetical protein